MNTEKLDQILASYREDIINTMKSWISIPSVQAPRSGENAPFGENVRAMLDLAMKDAAEMGFETREFDGYVMHAQMGHGEKTLGILAHLDVVPAGDGWTKDAWTSVVENGKIYGRGVVDDKGPAILALYAMKAVREAGIPLADGVRLILGCDEETGMTDMRHYAKNCDLPDYGFSPDAEFPVINIEKGGLSLNLGKVTGGEDGAEIPVLELYAGIRQNVVPGTARAVLTVKDKKGFEEKLSSVRKETGFDLSAEYEGETCVLTATGLSAHASVPHMGKNAAGMLLIALDKLNAGGGSREAISCLSRVLGLEGDGKSLGIAIHDELSGALTCNLGLLRYNAEEGALTARLDIRYPVSANEETMIGQAAKAVSGAKMFVQLVGSHPPLHVPADHKVVKGLLKVYGDVTGLPAHTIAIGGGTYSRCMPNTVAFGPTFPGEPDMCHMPDEFMDIDRMMVSLRVIAHAIAELAGKHE